MQSNVMVYRISVSEYKVAVCSLPGNRMGGARRSLVADLGETLGPGFRIAPGHWQMTA